MTPNTRWLRKPLSVLVAALVVFVAGCDGSILDVDDPDNVLPSDELSPGDVPSRFGGVVSDFANMYDFYVLYAGLFTDEFVLAGTFPTRLEIDRRAPNSSNVSIDEEVWEPLSVSRASADALVEEFTAALDDPAFEDTEEGLRQAIAFGRLFAGYDRIFFAELFCQSIFGGQEDFPRISDAPPETAPVSSDARMREAVGVLEAAGAAAAEAGEEDVRLAALVGRARALTWLGEHAAAADLVAEVPDEFVFLVEYSDNTIAQENEVFQQSWNINAGGLRWTVGDGTDASRGNERWAYYDEWLDQGLVLPSSVAAGPAEKNAFNGTSPVSLQTLYAGRSGDAGADASIVLASGWEARMIEAEAELRGGSPGDAQDIVNALLEDPAQTLNPMVAVQPDLVEPAGSGAFTDERLGDFAPVEFGDEPLQGDLVELARARSAGLWLTGERLGTLRRLAEEFDDRLALGLWPDRSSENAISLPVPDAEVDNNTNLGSACPAGLP